jgi:hypothetical protein
MIVDPEDSSFTASRVTHPTSVKPTSERWLSECQFANVSPGQVTTGKFIQHASHVVNPPEYSWRSAAQIPARTSLSDAISKDLKKRGFTFAGSTICYVLMQATGMVNDHLVGCFRHREVQGSAALER